ncbi:MAG: hypothetical protein IJD94_05055 [Clostridia bacterium]|nr:hypothetical protein [Clostridia bacterium]
MAVYSLKQPKEKKEREEEERLGQQAAEAPSSDTPEMPEPAQPQQPKQEAAKPDTPKQPENVTIEQTDGGVKANIGPTNRPMDADAAFLLEQRKQIRDVDMQLTETSDLEDLPETLTPHREALQEKNDSGGFIPSSVRNWGHNKADIYLDTIKDERQLAYTLSVLGSDQERVGLAKAWSDLHGMNAEDVIFHAEELLGERAFSAPQSAQGRLNAIGMVDLNGEKIDMGSADFATIVNAAQCIPDDDLRKQAFADIKALTKMKGGRFYGISMEGVSDDYRDTRDMPKAAFDSYADGLDAKFYGSEGHDVENLRMYLTQYDAINGENSALNGVQKHWYTQALNRAFVDQVYGGRGGVPDAEQARELLAQYDEAEAAQGEETESEDEPGFFEGIKNAVSSFLEGFRGEDEPEEAGTEAPEAAEAGSPQQAEPESEASEEQAEEPLTEAEQETSYAEPEDAQAGAAEVQGPIYRPEEGSGTAASAAPERASLIGDTATQLEYMHTGRFGEMDDASQAELRTYWNNASPATKAVMGLLTPEMQTLYESGNEGAESVQMMNTGIVGSSLARYAYQIQDESFPPELYGKAVLAIDQIVRAAEGDVTITQADLQEWGNRNEVYLSRHPEALAGIEGVFAELGSMQQAEADYAAKVQADAKAELERIGRAALVGQASDVQMAQLAASAGEISPFKLRRDDTFSQMKRALDDTYWRAATESAQAGDSFFTSTVYNMMKSRGVSDLDSSECLYEEMLHGQMNALLEQDAKVAATLGIPLEDLYRKWGGMNLDLLCQRANAEIRRSGAGLTQETIDAAEALVGDAGEKLGLGLKNVGELSVGIAKESVVSGFLETFITTTALTDTPRDVARVVSDYTQMYGPEGQSVYAREMRTMAESGRLPEGLSKIIIDYLDEGGNPYQLGIHPKDYGGVSVDAYAESQDRLRWYQGLIDNYATEGESKAIEVGSNTASNTALILMSAAATQGIGGVMMAAGAGAKATTLLAPFLGIRTVYGENQRGALIGEYAAKGYSKDEAMFLAETRVSMEALANATSLGHLNARLGGYSALVKNGLVKLGGANTPKAVQSVFQRAVMFGKPLLSELGEEAIKDPILEGLYGEGGEAAAKHLIEAAREGDVGVGDIAAAIGTGAATGVAAIPGTVEETIRNAPETIMMTLPIAILGAGGEYIQNSQSAKAAQAFVEQPTAKNAEALDKAVAQDAKDGRWIDALRQEGKTAEVEQTTSEILIHAPDKQLYEAAQKTREQANSHKAELESTEARLDTIRQSYADRKAAGDVDGQVREAREFAMATQGKAEHERELAQKTTEAKAAESALVQDARDRAVMEVDRRRMQANQRRLEESQNAESRAKAIETELESITTQMIEADERGDVQKAEELAQRHAQLLAEQVDLEDRMEAQAQAALEQSAQKDHAAQEKTELAPVFRQLYRTPVYVDATQAAEIRNSTGLTLPQFNRKYGFKLTSDKSKSAISLDGSFFADLAEMAPGYIEADAAHPEEAIIRLAERKKALSGVQAAIGETNAEAYMTDITYGMEDPTTAKLASDLHKKTGLTLVVASLEEGKRGWYDRKNKQLVLSNKLGAGEMRRQVVLHELTHFIENSPGYKAYKAAVLDAAYAMSGENREAMLERDREDLREEYDRNGIMLSDEELDAELVAAATEKVIGGDEAFFTQLIGDGHRSMLTRVYMKVKQFLARRKARKAGRETLAQYDAIQKAHDLMEKALKSTPKDDGTSGDIQYAVGEAETLKIGFEPTKMPDINVKGYLDGNKLRRDEIVRDAFAVLMERNEKSSHGGIKVKNDDTGLDINIIEKSIRHGLNRNNAAAQRSVKAAFALDDITKKAVLVGNGTPRDGKTGLRVFLSATSDKQFVYPVTLLVEQIPNGGMKIVGAEILDGIDRQKLYSYSVKKGIKRESAVSRTDAAETSSLTSTDSIISISSLYDVVKGDLKKTVEGFDPLDEFALSSIQLSVGLRQFGNNTMQRADFISDRVKELVRDSEYERDTNREQIERATKTLDSMGIDSAAAMLMGKEKKSYSADDNALAFVAMAEATRNGDETTAAMLAMRMLEESGEQGRALQSLKIGLKLTPEGAMAETIRKADRANAAHGIPAGSFPIGEGAPKTGGTQTSEDGTVTAKTPEAVEAVYRDAAEINAALEKLPGNISYDNPWQLPLSDRQMELIRRFRLLGEKLPGAAYNVATRKQRMLAAILAAGPEMAGAGQKALCQQLTAIGKGHAVVTKADLTYTAGQMAEFRMIEGGEATMPATQAGRMALGRAYQAQDNVTQEGFFGKWSALRFMNMLSAPATSVRNVTSNVLASGLEDVSTAIATSVDARIGKKTGNRTTTLAGRDEKRAAKKAFAKEVAQTYSDYFVTHVDTGHGRKYASGGQGRVFESEFLEGCRNLVDFAMQIGDRPFYERTYAQELAIVKRLGMKTTEMQDGKVVSRPMTEDEMHAEATARALKRVFQEDNQIVDALNGIKAKSPAADLFISTLMPFIKTPTNVAMRAIEYSPIGLGVTLARGIGHGIDSGKNGAISQRDYVMGIGRGLTGSGLLAAGYALAACGVIGFGRGEEEDEKRRGVMGALGEPYGMYIRIGDTKHEIDWAMPLSSAMAMGANLYKALDDGEGMAEATFGAILSGVGDQLMSTPMLSSMNDIFRGYDDTEDILIRLANTGATSLLNQTFSPAAIRAIAKAMDPYTRDTSDQSAVWSVLKQNLFQYWPGLRQMLPVKTDLAGDKQLQSGYWNPKGEHGSRIMQYLDSFLTPTATIGEKNDPALIELLDLSYRTEESAFLPAELISGKKYELKLNKSYAKALGYADAAIDMAIDDDEKRTVNAAYGDLLFNGDGGRPYADEKMNVISFPGLRAVMEDKAMYASGKYMQEKPWSDMSDEERVTLATRMRDDAKRLMIVDVARRKKGAGEI